MVTTALPVWGVAFLLGIGCWSIGASLISSKSPVVAMLCGWCVFLLLCTVPWVVGVSAHAVSPLFWLFAIAGLALAFRRRMWPELVCAALGTAVITALLGYPFIKFPGILAYGAHGLDMWGYVITSDWLQAHSIRDLPVVGVSPMRFNWTWKVLFIGDRPLIYETIACLGASTGLGVVKAYLALPVALLASLAMALGREPGMFGLKGWWWFALPLTLVVVFHPLVVLPWVAGFFGGATTAAFVALAFAGAAMAGTREERTEALMLAVLMLTFCGGLYSKKFLFVALAMGGVPGLIVLITAMLRHDLVPLRAARPSPRVIRLLAVIALVGLVVLVLGRDQKVDTGLPQLPVTAAGHFLGIFGGTSPYVWLGYGSGGPFDRDPIYNPLGCAALLIMLAILVLVSWARWRASRDVRIPMLVVLLVGLVWQTVDDELIMAKALTVFGFTLMIVLATVSGELRHRWLGLLAAVACCLPGLRSAAEMHEIISGPYITCTEKNVADISDGQDWRVLAYLHYREDRDGFDWPKNPHTYSSVTHFLPSAVKMRLAEKYHMGPR